MRDPFAGNRIPAGRLDANALRLMQLYPEPNVAGLNNNYVVNRTNTDDTHSFDVRVDHNFSGNDRFFARYSFSDNHKVRPSPFDGDGDGGGFSEGDEKVRVHGFAASHTHMFSPTLINEARFGLSREHTNRLPPYGADTSDMPGEVRHPRHSAGGRQRRPADASRSSSLSNFGHAGWVVSERFSNTLQFSDNLTKVYKSHTFKGGYMYQDIFFGSTQPPYARGEYSWDGRYTSLVNQADNTHRTRARSCWRRSRRWSRAAWTIVGGMNDIRVSPFGDVDAFKTYHGAYAQDSWRVNSQADLELRRALGLLQPRAGEGSGAGEHGARSAGAIPDSGRVAETSRSRRASSTTWRRTASSWSTPTSSAAASARCRRTTSRRGSTPPTRSRRQVRGARRLRTVLRRVREPRRQPEPRLQLPVPVHAASTSRRTTRAEPAGATARSSASTPRDRILLDPVNVNANGLHGARRRVRLQDAALPQLQRHAADRSHARVTRSRSATSARVAATSRRSPG